MRDFLIAGILFGAATWITLLAHSSLFPPDMFLPFLASCMMVTLLLLGMLQLPQMKRYIHSARWILVFLVTLVLHLIVLSTGSLYSPFLILLFLVALVFSLFFSFPISLSFMAFSLFTILLTMYSQPELRLLLEQDPIKAGIYALSFVIVIPLFHLLTAKYHVKDKTLKHLSAEVNVEDSLLDEVSELVIVTDTAFHVLSVNDAVEKYLHRSRSEIIDQPLFDIVYLQDTTGSLVTKDMLTITDPTHLSPHIFHNLRLITTPIFADNVELYVKPIPDFEGKIIQLLFIISDSNPNKQKTPVSDTFLHTRIRYEAMIETLKRQLKSAGTAAHLFQFILITNFQQDMLNTQVLEEHGIQLKETKVDLAKLCKQTLLTEQDFAGAFRVRLQFLLPDFSEKDVSPLVTDVMEVKPEEFTGPFFTTTCDTQYVSLVIQKLLDIATLMAVKETNPEVELRIERKVPTMFSVSVVGPCPDIEPDEIHAIFTKFYGVLNTKTNLNAGSGLEGYLAKTVSDQLQIPLEVSYTKNRSLLRWTLQIPKTK